MAREEAAERLKAILAEATAYEDAVCYVTSDDADVLRVAIKALEQQPSEDCISREEAINKINTLIAEYIPLMPTGWTLPLNIARTINELPPVTPQPITLEKAIDYLHEIGWMQEHDKEMAQLRWISVSERLPEKNVEVLATTVWGAVTIAEKYSANNWFIHEGTTNAEIDEIVAWMPLPEPYRAESEDKE